MAATANGGISTATAGPFHFPLPYPCRVMVLATIILTEIVAITLTSNYNVDFKDNCGTARYSYSNHNRSSYNSHGKFT